MRRLGARERDLDLLEFEIGEIEAVGPGRGRGGGPRARARPARRGRDAAPRRRPRRPRRSTERDGLARRDGAAGGRGRASSRRRRSDDALGSLARRAESLSYELQDLAARAARLPARSRRTRSARGRRGAARAARAARSASTAARSRRCSSTPSAAAPSATGSRTPARRRRGSSESWAPRGRARRAGGAAAPARGKRRPRRSRTRCARSWRSWRWRSDASRSVIEARPSAGEGPLARSARRRRRGRVPDRPEPGRAARAAARGRLRRRALARDARADERRDRGEGSPTVVFDEVDAGVGGATARAWARGCARFGRAPGPLHHPPAAGGVARHAALPRREAGAAAARRRARATAGPRGRRAARARGAGRRSCAACWAPTRATRPPGDMPKGCSRPRRIPLRGRGSLASLQNAIRAQVDWPASRTTTRATERAARAPPFAALVPEVQRDGAARQAHEGPRAPADAGRHRDHRPRATSTAWRPRTSSSAA